MKSSIKCLICQKEFKRLTQTHLKKHDLTPNTYKEKFGVNSICSEQSSTIQSQKLIEGQFNGMINNLKLLGFEPKFSINEYSGVFDKYLIKCNKCDNEFLCKLCDRRKIICRKCIPYKKKKVIEFKYIDILNNFQFIKCEEEKTMSGIYIIKNKINGKFYVGSSDDIRHRWYEHVYKLRKNKHNNPHFQNAWNKYGENNFEFLIVEKCNKDELLIKEQYYISKLQPFKKNGYNICDTAGGGDNITHNPNKEAFIDKMKIINKGEGNGMFGKTHNENTIKLMEEKSVGRYTLDWFIERNGQIEGERKFQERNVALRSRDINYSYDNKMTGKKRGPMSEEIKKRISERKHHLKVIRNDLHKDILSNNFTIPQLESKYGTSKATILRERRKLL